ncbi:hypothetical protein [Poseidonocella sp. HB161398]|uniref:hypothetical protein n=1 Tax=Poseidonocella sp. HB161398 TaxID=2320855 RepID=UPI0011081206|nr:hypothetical protein [Poseidonocella sp. HB161398]
MNRSFPRLAAVPRPDLPASAAGGAGNGVAEGGPQRVLLHIGAPKSATSTVQQWTSTNRIRLGRSGIKSLIPASLRKPEIVNPFLRYVKGETAEIDVSALKALIAEAEKPKVLASEETLTNVFIPGYCDEATGFGAIGRVADLLEALELPGLEILLTVRRQDRYLRSCYGHRVKRNGETAEFDDWVARRVDLEALSWEAVTETLEARFGAERVTVVPFEMLESADEAALYARCLAPLGADVSHHLAPSEPEANATLSETATEIARVLNRLPVATRKAQVARIELLTRIHDFATALGDPPARPGLDAVTELCRARYAEGNARLAARKFPDIASSFAFGSA